MSVSPCEIISRQAQPTVCWRTVAPVTSLPQVLGEAFGLLMGYLGRQGQVPISAPYVAYFNMDMQALQLEVGFPVAQALPAEGAVQSGEIPAGDYASLTHTGPYPTLSEGYQALTEFVTQQGKEPTGIAYEFYLNDASITPAEQLQTQIFFPLK